MPMLVFSECVQEAHVVQRLASSMSRLGLQSHSEGCCFALGGGVPITNEIVASSIFLAKMATEASIVLMLYLPFLKEHKWIETAGEEGNRLWHAISSTCSKCHDRTLSVAPFINATRFCEVLNIAQCTSLQM